MSEDVELYGSSPRSFSGSPSGKPELLRCDSAESLTEVTSIKQSTIYISVVMPCLNEALTIGECVEQAKIGCRHAIRSSRSVNQTTLRNKTDFLDDCFEIIVADNGSTDGSDKIAAALGAQVVRILDRGYGAALKGGFAHARGVYVVMGDSDCSYDFNEVTKFIEVLERGYQLVIGNRFAGEIKDGAMPWLHRYIGNPVLSCIGRLFFGSPCRDWHCGIRAFDRVAFSSLSCQSPGMEYASEMIVKAIRAKLSIAEVPVTLSPDKRNYPPHLRSFRDGFRHLRLLCKERFSL